MSTAKQREQVQEILSGEEIWDSWNEYSNQPGVKCSADALVGYFLRWYIEEKGIPKNLFILLRIRFMKALCF